VAQEQDPLRERRKVHDEGKEDTWTGEESQTKSPVEEKSVDVLSGAKHRKDKKIQGRALKIQKDRPGRPRKKEKGKGTWRDTCELKGKEEKGVKMPSSLFRKSSKGKKRREENKASSQGKKGKELRRKSSRKHHSISAWGKIAMSEKRGKIDSSSDASDDYRVTNSGMSILVKILKKEKERKI